MNEEKIKQIEDVAETIAWALFEILRCAIYSAKHPRPASQEQREFSNTHNLREGARNVARKLCEQTPVE